MLYLYRFDDEKFYVEDMRFNPFDADGNVLDAPPNTTDIPPPNGLYRGKFVPKEKKWMYMIK